MAKTEVAVTHVQQETTYFCGPATAEMTLAALGVPSPATSSDTWQAQLWEDVKTQTKAKRPKGAPDEEPKFDTQRCVKWQDDWKCWPTTPGALRRVLKSKQSTASFTVRRCTSEQQATRQLIKAIDAGIPGIVLVYGWQHWIVVSGYEFDDAASVSTGDPDRLFLCDPWSETPLLEVDWRTWADDYLWTVPAGKYKDTIVVVKGSRRT